MDAPAPPVDSVLRGRQSAEAADRVFDEFNTLSVVYRAPASTFIDLRASLGEEAGRGWGEGLGLGEGGAGAEGRVGPRESCRAGG